METTTLTTVLFWNPPDEGREGNEVTQGGMYLLMMAVALSLFTAEK